ncbi:hypothetical protein V6N13_089731 [Hibiscus sabdariffa]
MARLRGVQRAHKTRTSHYLSSLEEELAVDLENILDQEEVICKQKSRSDWITTVNHNTLYFHRQAIARKQRNKITSPLQILDETWCEDDPTLNRRVIDYFQSLFALDPHLQEENVGIIVIIKV